MRFLLLRSLRFVLSLFQAQKLRSEFSRLWWNFRYCQVRPVVPVHHLGAREHGQEAGGEHLQVGGPGHARGHGRRAGWGRKAAVLGSQLPPKPSRETTSQQPAAGARVRHLGSRPPAAPGYGRRALRGRTRVPSGPEARFQWFLSVGRWAFRI